MGFFDFFKKKPKATETNNTSTLEDSTSISIDEIIESMTEYMEDNDDCGYTKAHVNNCRRILNEYVKDLKAIKSNDSEIMKCVEKTVKALNALNDEVDGCLIETMEREDLCAFIQEKAHEFGLTETDVDITEDWREW